MVPISSEVPIICMLLSYKLLPEFKAASIEGSTVLQGSRGVYHLITVIDNMHTLAELHSNQWIYSVDFVACKICILQIITSNYSIRLCCLLICIIITSDHSGAQHGNMVSEVYLSAKNCLYFYIFYIQIDLICYYLMDLSYQNINTKQEVWICREWYIYAITKIKSL